MVFRFKFLIKETAFSMPVVCPSIVNDLFKMSFRSFFLYFINYLYIMACCFECGEAKRVGHDMT